MTSPAAGAAAAAAATAAAQERNVNALLVDMERQHAALRRDYDAVQIRLVRTERDNANLVAQVERGATDKQKLSELQSTLQATTQSKANSDAQLATMQQRLDRMQQDYDAAAQEMTALRKERTALSEQLASQQVSTKIQESQALPLWHEKERLQTVLDQTTKQVEFYRGEMESQVANLRKTQRDARDRLLQTQLQLQQTEQELSAVSAREETLRTVEQRLQEQVEQLSQDVVQTKKQLVQTQQEMRDQKAADARLTQLQQRHLQEWEHKHDRIAREAADLKKAANEASRASEVAVDKVREELQQKYQGLLQEQAAEYQAKLDGLQQQHGAPPAVAGLLPAAASLAIADTMEGEEISDVLSLTQVHEKWQQAQEAYRREKLRADKATLHLQRMTRDVEEQAPRIVRQRRELEHALEMVQDYRTRLESALHDRDEARQTADEAVQQSAAAQRECSAQRDETQVLAQQVQALLTSRVTDGSSGAGEWPLTVADVQQQNQRLLVDNRRLEREMQTLQKRAETDRTAQQLDEARAALAAMQREQKKQQEAVQTLAQQRDLYRAVAETKGHVVPGGDDGEQEGDYASLVSVQALQAQTTDRVKALQGRIQELQDQVTTAEAQKVALARDKEAAGERLARLETYNQELAATNTRHEQELSAARGQAARADTEGTYHKERAARLEESLQRAREEVTHVMTAKTELQRINAELQASASSAREAVTAAEEGQRRAESQYRLAETRAGAAEATQQRLTEENSQLRAQITKHGTVMDNIAAIHRRLSVRSDGEKERLEAETQRLTQQLAAESKKFDTETTLLRERVSALDARLLQAQQGKDAATTQVDQAKEATQAAEKKQREAESQVQALTTKLRVAHKKLGLDPDKSLGSDVATVSLQSRIETLSTELESAQEQVKTLQESVETYKKLAKEAEANAKSTTMAVGELKKAHAKELQEVKAKKESLEKDIGTKEGVIVELTKDLSSQRDEREKAVGQLQSEIAKLKGEIESNVKSFESAQATAAAAKTDLEMMGTEIGSVQENYQRELQLHAKSISSMKAAEEKFKQEAQLRLAAEGKLATLEKELLQNKDLWEQEKDGLQKSNQTLEQANRESREQNKALHVQVETLRESMEKSQTSRPTGVGGAAEGESTQEAESLQKELASLKEVERFVRSENELLHARLDAAKNEAERETATCSVLKSSLEQARAELKTVRDNANAEESTSRATELSDKLRASEEQVKVLGDSNRLLRSESEQLSVNLKKAQQEVESTKAAMAPLEKTKRDLEAKIAIMQAENDSLRRDLDEWKARVNSLVSKFHKVDPVEHQKALARVTELEKEKKSQEDLKVASQQQSDRIREVARKLKKANVEQTTQLESQKKEIEKLTAEKATLAKASGVTKERDELKVQLATAKASYDSVTKELDSTNTRAENLRTKLRQFQVKIRDQQAKEKSLTEELKAAKEAAAAAAVDIATTETAATAPSEKPPVEIKAGIKAGLAAAVQEKHVAVKDADADAESKPAPTGAKAPATKQEVLPKVPEGGFKFGPSKTATSGTGSLAQPVVASAVAAASSATKGVIRADAAPFVPKGATGTAKAASQLPSKKRKAEQSEAKPAAEETTPPAAQINTPDPAQRRNSGETKELSMKEMLIEKRKKLKAALEKAALEKEKKRKLEASKESEKEAKEPEAPVVESEDADSSAPSDVKAAPAQKKLRTEELETPPSDDAQMEEKKDIDEEKVAAEATEVAHPSSEPAGIMASADEEEDGEVEEPADSDAPAEESKEDGAAVDKKLGVGFPFGGGSANPFGTGGVAVPTTFGQAASLVPGQPSTGFGVVAATQASGFGAAAAPTGFGGTAASGFGGAAAAPPAPGAGASGTLGTTPNSSVFLNMRPPGSSASPPTFSFGRSGLITLPTPSQPMPQPSNPFGSVFGGGFSGSTPTSLFGAAPPATSTTDVAAEDQAVDEADKGAEEKADE